MFGHVANALSLVHVGLLIVRERRIIDRCSGQEPRDNAFGELTNAIGVKGRLIV